MAIDLAFRKAALKNLPTKFGVYVLCDLDQVPLYVGKSVKGIRGRVARHLTSARSDIIANRQIDVWEVAWVWAYPLENKGDIGFLEAVLIDKFHSANPLINGFIPPKPVNMEGFMIPDPTHRIQVMRSEEIAEKLDPAVRLPRQAEHYSALVGHFLAVKNSEQIARAMGAHFARLSKYHNMMLGLAAPDPETDEGKL
jgi:hypothetical protein